MKANASTMPIEKIGMRSSRTVSAKVCSAERAGMRRAMIAMIAARMIEVPVAENQSNLYTAS
ncbi:hypothetical protein D3C73_1655800 [compost metagenome]